MAFGNDVDIEFGTSGVDSTSRDIRRVADDVDGVGTKGRRMGNNMKAGAAIAVTAIASVVAIGAELGQTGLELELMGQRVDTIFAEYSTGVNEWAETVDTAMGTSSQRVAGMAANVGDLLIPLGATREEAAQLSQRAVELASSIDLWSTATQSTEEATERLTKGMLGETDGLLALGINIKAATIDTYLLETGQADLEGQALALARANAVLEIATQQSGDAIAFAGSDAAETQLKVREMQERWTSLKDDLSEELLPVLIDIGEAILDLADWIENKAIPAGTRFYNDWISPTIDGIQWVTDKVNGLINAIDRIQFPAVPGYVSGGDGYGSALSNALGNVTGLRFAQGTEVQPSIGGTVARIAEGGEAEQVIPSARLAGMYGDQGGGGGIHLHIHPGMLTPPATIGAAAVDAIRAYERRNGTQWRQGQAA